MFSHEGLMDRDQNTAELLRYERLQEAIDRMPPEIPDFTAAADLRQAGIIKELQPAMAEVMRCFQSGLNGRHEDLLRACALLERSLYSCWQDEV